MFNEKLRIYNEMVCKKLKINQKSDFSQKSYIFLKNFNFLETFIADICHFLLNI